MKQEADVVVIGGGIIGLCSAINLLRRGRQVTLIDRLPPGDAGAASFGNAGSLSWSSCIPIAMPGLLPKVPGWLLRSDGPLTIRWRHLPSLAPWLWRFVRSGTPDRVAAAAAALSMLHTPALELHRALAVDAGVADLIRDCDFLHIYAAHNPARLDELEWRLRAQHGAKLQLLNQAELSDKVPQLARRYPQTVSIGGQGYIANPSRLVAAYAQQFVAEGGRIEQQEVRGFVHEAGHVSSVRTDTLDISANEVVIAAGPWSTVLTRMLNLNLPLDTERGYHVSVADAGVDLKDTIMETDGKFMVTPMETGLRFAGTVELANIDAPPDYRRADTILAHAKTMFPEMPVQRVSKWMGRRPSFPDGLPAIGAAPDYDNVVLAFGHAHTGMVAAPQTGRLVADLVTDTPINADMRLFAAERFG
jgi:D-amino-acid dehydrogenase